MANDEEPTMEIDDDEFALEDEPTMEVEDMTADLSVSDDESGLDVSDDEVGAEDEGEGEEDGGYAAMMSQVAVEVPSATSFNALLVVSFAVYAATLVLLLWRLGQYVAPGTFPWN